MAEEKEEPQKVYVIPDEWMKNLDKKIDGVCKGVECLPDLSKKMESIPELTKKIGHLKIPPAKPEKHNVFSWMTFCPECGEKLREEPPEYECTNCKVPVDPKKDKVCWNCGSKKAKKRELKLK